MLRVRWKSILVKKTVQAQTLDQYSRPLASQTWNVFRSFSISLKWGQANSICWLGELHSLFYVRGLCKLETHHTLVKIMYSPGWRSEGKQNKYSGGVRTRIQGSANSNKNNTTFHPRQLNQTPPNKQTNKKHRQKCPSCLIKLNLNPGLGCPNTAVHLDPGRAGSRTWRGGLWEEHSETEGFAIPAPSKRTAKFRFTEHGALTVCWQLRDVTMLVDT